MKSASPLELWGGVECSVVRIGDEYRNQIVDTGHQSRFADLDAMAELGIKAVRYPILARATGVESRTARREILEIRHSSLYAPRDFDISPYFAVVKPTIERGFNYKALHWADLPRRLQPQDEQLESADEPAVTLAP